MPLLTSKNIWCPCLPHHLICNTFCRCFHLAGLAWVNNPGCLYSYFPVIWCLLLLLDRVASETITVGRGLGVKCGARSPPSSSFLLVLLGADLVAAAPRRLRGIPCVPLYRKRKKNTTVKERCIRKWP